MGIRFAKSEDAKNLLNIYEQYIDTPITFEYVLPTIEEFAGRIGQIGAFYPYLICEDGGRQSVTLMGTVPWSGPLTSGMRSYPSTWIKILLQKGLENVCTPN